MAIIHYKNIREIIGDILKLSVPPTEDSSQAISVPKVESQKIPIFSIAGEPYNELLAKIATQADADLIIFGGMGLLFDDYYAFRKTFEDHGSQEFADKESARHFFTKLISLLKNLNYSSLDSDSYAGYYKQIIELVGL